MPSTMVSYIRRGDDSAAITAGPGTHIDQIIRRHDHIRIVLDHDGGIAAVGQMLECTQQRAHFDGMHAPRPFIHQYGDAGQPGGQYVSELYALCLSRRQGGRTAIQMQISQSQLAQQIRSKQRLFENGRRQHLLLGRYFQCLQNLTQLGQGHVGQLLHVESRQLHCQVLGS